MPGVPAAAWGDDSTRRVMTGGTGQTGESRLPPRRTGQTGERTSPSVFPPKPKSAFPPRPSAPPGAVRPSGPPPLRSPRSPGTPPPPPRSSVVPASGDVKDRMAALMAQLQAARDRLTKNENEMGGLRSRLGLLDARVGELEEEGPGQAGTADGARDAERIAALEKRLEELAALPDVVKRVDTLESMAEKVRAGDSALRGILDQQRKSEEGRASALSELTDRVRQLSQTVENLSVAQAESKARQERLVKALAGKDEALAELREAVETRGREITDLREALGARDAEIERLREALKAVVSDTALLRVELDERHGAVTAAEGGSTRPYGTPSQEDDLKRIKGIGPKFERALKEMGVCSFGQIAAWTEDDVQSVAERIGTKPQRIQRDGWIAHATKLAAGG